MYVMTLITYFLPFVLLDEINSTPNNAVGEMPSEIWFPDAMVDVF